MWSMNGSTSGLSSATTKSTLRAIRLEMNATSRRSIELGDDDRAAESLRSIERRCKLWPAIERLRALAGFDLGHFGRDLQPLGLGEPGDRRALCFEAVAGPQSCARMRAIALGP